MASSTGENINVSSVAVKEETICEQFRAAMKDENKEQQCIDDGVDTLKEMLKKAPTAYTLTVKDREVKLVNAHLVIGGWRFIGTADHPNEIPSEGLGQLQSVSEETLHSDTKSFRLVISERAVTIFFLGERIGVPPLGVFRGELHPPATGSVGGEGKWIL